MKKQTFGLAVLLCFLTTAACLAEIRDVQIGTWKLDPARSKLSRYMGRNDMVDYEWSFFKTKVTVSGVDAHGQPMHSEWKGNFDGHDYPVTGDPTSDARAYTKVNDHTLNFAGKSGGQVIYSGVVVVSPDGKTRTVTTTAMRGKKRLQSVAVYEKVK
ncbi:MAG: hypothetical protein ACJ8KU_04675 [Chthoniobacterales bacterium]